MRHLLIMTALTALSASALADSVPNIGAPLTQPQPIVEMVSAPFTYPAGAVVMFAVGITDPGAIRRLCMLIKIGTSGDAWINTTQCSALK